MLRRGYAAQFRKNASACVAASVRRTEFDLPRDIREDVISRKFFTKKEGGREERAF